MQAHAAAAAAPSGAARRVVIWSVPVLVALVLVMLTVPAASAMAPGDIVFAAVMVTVVEILALVGAVLADRAPANRIGAWQLVASILITAGLALASYAKIGQATTPDPWPGAAVAATLGIFPNIFGIGIVLILVPAIFPTGTLLSPRWRYLIGLSLVALLATCFSQLVPGGTDADPGTKTMADALSAFSSLTLVVGFIGALSSVVIRFRRGSPIEREQTKWFLAAVVFAVIAFLAAFAVPQDTPTGTVLFGLALAAPPVAIGIAVLRYRLCSRASSSPPTASSSSSCGPSSATWPAEDRPESLYPRSSSHRSSTRSADGSSRSSTGVSTVRATTPSGPSPSSPNASATRSISMRSSAALTTQSDWRWRRQPPASGCARLARATGDPCRLGTGFEIVT